MPTTDDLDDPVSFVKGEGHLDLSGLEKPKEHEDDHEDDGE
jgi:hypothetical protein